MPPVVCPGMSEHDIQTQTRTQEHAWLIDGHKVQAMSTLFPLGLTCKVLPQGSCDEIQSSEEGWVGAGKRMLC